MEVKFKKLSEEFVLPIQGSVDAACFDCIATSVKLIDDSCLEYGLGFSTEFSEKGWKGIIVPRSNITKTQFVMQNSPAQIDEDYRGEWKVRFRLQNLMPKQRKIKIPYKIGERICQIYFEKVNKVNFKVVEELTESNRGSGGFGSTGLK